ncbi:arylacetamide deacetylase-like 2, partial [Psammomys obesus]|uniref:arylacetamide deacetylase-like 2 n=1 Tax=Psammomys obesus TaxID=48139 RepID=UPI002453648D
MGYKILCFGIFCVVFAYYIYTPIPENIEERWRVRMIDAVVKTTSLVATLFEEMGLMKYEDTFLTLSSVHLSKPVSDENVTVIDTNFSDIPVRLYLPKKKSEILRPAIIYLHGGAFVLGSCKMQPYDDLNRWTANKLDAVVVGIDYRLAPQYPFPAALEDSVLVVKFILQDKILDKYGVDPACICISGDSSGATLAAAATQL